MAHNPVLIAVAQSIIKDDNHWSQVDVVDRAESAVDLARLVLETFKVSEEDCQDNCEMCKQHQAETEC